MAQLELEILASEIEGAFASLRTQFPTIKLQKPVIWPARPASVVATVENDDDALLVKLRYGRS